MSSRSDASSSPTVWSPSVSSGIDTKAKKQTVPYILLGQEIPSHLAGPLLLAGVALAAFVALLAVEASAWYTRVRKRRKKMRGKSGEIPPLKEERSSFGSLSSSSSFSSKPF